MGFRQLPSEGRDPQRSEEWCGLARPRVSLLVLNVGLNSRVVPFVVGEDGLFRYPSATVGAEDQWCV